MKKAKLLVLGVLAASALSLAAGAGSAQAAGHWCYMVEGVSGCITQHYSFVKATHKGEYVLKGTPLGVSAQIECKEVSVKGGGILPEGLDFADLDFEACAVIKPAGCVVSEPILVEVDSMLTGLNSVAFTPLKAEEEFTQITFTNLETCSLKGKSFKVQGKQNCNTPGASTEAAAHTIECLTTGSELKLGGKAATFSGNVTNLELESGKKWSVLEF